MSGSIAPPVTGPGTPPATVAPGGQQPLTVNPIDQGSTVPATTVGAGGLINVAPGIATYTPTSANASTVSQVAGSTPNTFSVTPNQTVAGQISNIIAAGSPLMQQAEANANMQMNQRGLINSTQAITAGQNAVYQSALPIASADAATYATAATNTTQAQNAAMAARAAAANTAYQTNAQLLTQNNQFNAGSVNTALGAATAQSNSYLQATRVAGIQAAATVQAAQTAAQAQIAVANINAKTSTGIAQIQSDTSLSIAAQQVQSAQLIDTANNATQVTTTNLNNAAALQNIAANGQINVAITNLTDQNKALLQTSASASQIYSQALTNMSSIMTNPNLSGNQQTTILNDQVKQLNDALQAIQGIANNTQVSSNLQFNPPPTPTTYQPTYSNPNYTQYTNEPTAG